jgi:ATP-dependent helicase HrpA
VDDFRKTLKSLEQNLTHCMVKDRHGLRRDLLRIKERIPDGGLAGEGWGASITSLEQRFRESMDRCRTRRKSVPRLSYNPDLPITLRKDEIIESIRTRQVLILSGETGSGKTTQIPKFCLAAGRGITGAIACTQPRRIAALSVSERIAEELGEETGLSVGYQIRFQEKTSENTLIKVMTDGVLLAEIQKDRYLNAYDTIIVDEAHERSLNIDFILGILLDLLKKRRDLKVIVTSATIDTQKFSEAFGGAKVIEVSGRTFPVDLIYSPAETKEEEDEYVDRAVAVVEEINRFGPHGDILMFMPTEADIKECCELLNGRSFLNATVMPLFARMSANDQKQIFGEVRGRKIVVATNVAETSITIPGIRYVVDTGLARIPRYTPRTRTTSLPVTVISQSSADQRKGRAGRVENGVCYRLYSEKDYLGRPVFTSPHILRANLAEVILRMIALNLGDVSIFPFIDPPSPRSVKDGFDTLIELGAITQNARPDKKGRTGYGLTEQGKIMARIPLDPTLSRMLIEASRRGCLPQATIIISALSIRDPRERPLDKAQQADQAHAAFKDPSSDFITLLNIWNAFESEAGKSGKRAAVLRQFCKTRYMSFLRMREWQDIHAQLSTILAEQGLSSDGPLPPEEKGSPFRPLYKAIHQALLSGYLSGIAVKKEKNLYTATRGREAMIFPGSGLFNNGGNWIMAAEMVETSRLYARTTANIDPAWLLELGGASLVRSYDNPRWDRKKGAVVVTEHTSLFGLTVASGTVLYGRVKPGEAAGIFIRSALVEGDLDLERTGKELSFIRHNLALADEVRAMEDKVRRRDLLVPEEILSDFYESRLKDISDVRSLSRYIREKGGCRFLEMDRDMLLRYEPDSGELNLYPDTLSMGGASLSVSYSFNPGAEEDGVTLTVPSGSVGAVKPEALDWLVPGLVREKIEGMIKGLPKEYRRRLVPVTDTASVVARELPELKKALETKKSPETPLETALSRFIKTRFGVDIPATAWSGEKLSSHLAMRITITNPKGQVLAQGRDKNLLFKDFSGREDDGFDKAKARYEKENVTFSEVGEVLPSVPLLVNGAEKGIAFPGFRAEDGKVSLRLFRRKDLADRHHLRAVRLLFEKALSERLKDLKKDLVLKGQSRHYATYFGGEKNLNAMMTERVSAELFSKNIRTRRDFEVHAKESAPQIHVTGRKILDVATAILNAYHEARSLIHDRELKEISSGLADGLGIFLRKELDHLVPGNFLDLYDMDRLAHLERYIRGIRMRAQRAFENPDKDRMKAAEIKPFTDILSGFLETLSDTHSGERKNSIEEFFWLIEEFKVSVFAPELKTPVKVSAKRLKALADDIRRMI